MAPLETTLRNMLERAVVRAYALSTEAAGRALDRLAIEEHEPKMALSLDERTLRRALRAKREQLGTYARLVNECAYEHWHRMLFARFLAENGLLMHPTGVPVTLEECKELAGEEGAADGWALAERYAARMLPQIFRPDDQLLRVELAPEDRQALEAVLAGLPMVIFTADDSLGWVYQFWQKTRKDEINASEEKIGGDRIGPVTQLFTEHYMVQFLLHNTLGAWWAGRTRDETADCADGTDSGAARQSNSPNLRQSAKSAVPPFAYLRFLDDGTPAAGTFPGWPETARELRVLDPCCGSGHFLVAAFEMLLAFRMAEEGLSEAAAGDAVLRDNLFGLDIDQRCTQIAAFALALAAWKRGGYRELPAMSVACSGIPVGAKRETWMRLAQRSPHGFMWGQLYDMFRQAPDLGSLIDPKRILAGTMYSNTFPELQKLLTEAMSREADDETQVVGVAAQGIARAAELLVGQYHLVTTNVPYLGRSKQGEVLANYCKDYYSETRADLATVFVQRGLDLCVPDGVIAFVTPQNWLLQPRYRAMRRAMLNRYIFDMAVVLGGGGDSFEAGPGNITTIAMLIVRSQCPGPEAQLVGLDVTQQCMPSAKAEALRTNHLFAISQERFRLAPDMHIVVAPDSGGTLPLLSDYAASPIGIMTGDTPRHMRSFWELPRVSSPWRYCQTGSEGPGAFGGMEVIVEWANEDGQYPYETYSVIVGREAWGKQGVAVTLMSSDLRCALYTGDVFDKQIAVLVPNDADLVPAIWAYCQSPFYRDAVRRIDTSLKVTNRSLAKVPFDLAHWQQVADEMGPLPEPYSEDPTQWLFKGHPARSTAPLQVAVARLLGYRWPEQPSPPQPPSPRGEGGDDGLDALADHDGIVCLPPVGGERPGADRLRDLLAAAYGDAWTPATLDGLLADAGYGGKSLADWLRDGFFAQHCKLFHHRPFIWQVWDGRKDGFSALVNYHRLDTALLERLTYTILGDWITRQRQAMDAQEPGSDARYVAALALQEKLKLILAGEPPHDLFIRWKPLAQQPLGWDPDLNDGVRLNIRPFMAADILRARPNIKWGKDRGKDPESAPWYPIDNGDRINDHHLTLAEKRAAREQGKA